MIARITGILESVSAGRLVVAPVGAGMAFDVLVPATLSDDLTASISSEITLHTLMHLEAHGQGSSMTPRLIGFASTDDRRFFELFTTVKGLGPRRALRAMAAPVPDIARAVAERDAKTLQRLPEIGKRLSETIIVDLHGKVDIFLMTNPDTPGPSGAPLAEPKGKILGDAAQQAIEALQRLGETKDSAERAVETAIGAQPTLTTADEILAAAFGAGIDSSPSLGKPARRR